MNFDSQIRLTFHAMVGRGDCQVPLVAELFTGGSQQLVQIHVNGTLQEPVVRREAFPAVNRTLGLLRAAAVRYATMIKERNFPILRR